MAGLTIENPVTLTEALRSRRIVPGDTLRLLPGVYTGNFVSQQYLAGTEAKPITITAHVPGTVKIDGSLALESGENIIIDGIEFTYTGWPTRTFGSAQENNYPCNLYVSSAINTKIRNCYIHDGFVCVAAYGNQLTEMYGCVVGNGGYNNSGHSIYTHNHSGTYSLFENNIWLASFDYGFHAHSSWANNIDNYHLKNNIFGKCNAKHTFGNDSGLPNVSVRRILFEDNENMDTWWWFNRWTTPLGEDITITGNWFDGSNVNEHGCLKIKSMQAIVFTGNTCVYEGDGGFVHLKVPPGVTTNYTFSGNHYYGAAARFPVSVDNGEYINLTLEQWQALGHDADAVYQTSSPANRVRVIPNKYDVGRCNVAIYNYSLADSVIVDVSSVYSVDDVVLVRQAQDYINDVQTLTVDPLGHITIDMRAETHSVALPIGHDTAIDPLMPPKYGAFVIERVS